MKVSKAIQNKMRKLANLTTSARELAYDIDNYFIDKGLDIETLRRGNGISLDELDYGNDITDLFVKWAERDFDDEAWNYERGNNNED